MAFLGGLLSTLGPMLPGIVGTVGDIVKRIANRPEGQSFGSALLGAAPAALSGISGVAKQLAPALGGAAGGVLSKIGQGADLAGQFVQSAPYDNAKKSEYQKLEDDFVRRRNEGDGRNAALVLQEMESIKRGLPRDTHVMEEAVDENGDPIDDSDDYVEADRIAKLDDGAILLRKFIKDKFDEKFGSGSSNERPKSTVATDMLPVRHGAPGGVPAISKVAPLVNASGPFASHSMPPAAMYDDKGYQNDPSMFDRPINSLSDERPKRGASSMPVAQRNYQGVRSVIDRTQQHSHGVMPSFNIFDKLAPSPRERVRVVEEAEPTPQEIIRYRTKYIKRKAKKAAKRR